MKKWDKNKWKQIRPSSILTGVAVVLFLGGLFVAYQAIQNAQNETWTVVMTQPTDGYTQLTPDEVTLVQKPIKGLSGRAIRLPKPMDLKSVWDKTVLNNQVFVRPMNKGETLTLDDLTSLKAALPALLVKTGHANDIAVSVPVNPNNGMSFSQINNGDYLYLSTAKNVGNQGKVIVTIDSHALVLAKEGKGQEGYVYLPLTKEEFTLVQQTGGVSRLMVGLTAKKQTEFGMGATK